MIEGLQSLPDPLMRAITLIAALFPLVMVHEVGHFVVAKLQHIRVDEFGIGFPPRMVRLFTHGGTDYTLNWLPIGGFVRLAGEDDPDLPDSFASKSKFARVTVLVAGPVANFLLAAAIFMVVAVPEQVPAINGVTVAGFAPVAGTDSSPAQAAGLQPYDIVVAVDGQPLPAPAADAAADETAAMTALQRLTNEHAGRAMTLTVLRGLTALPAAAPGSEVTLEPTTIPGMEARRVASTSPGSSFRIGDIVVLAQDVSNTNDGDLLLLRGIAQLDVEVVPAQDSTDGKWRMGVSIVPAVVPLQLPPVPAVRRGVALTGAWMQAMVGGLADMVTGRQPVALAGPVKISEMSRDMSSQGLDKFLQFMALLSINLGIINLLPIPALDGGRLLFIAAETVRGKRIEPAREAVVHLIGFVLVIGLMLALTAVELFHIGSP